MQTDIFQSSLKFIAYGDRPIEGLALEEAEDIESPQATADVIPWCKEYAEKYENENRIKRQCLWRKVAGNPKWIMLEVDNYPAKIVAPGGMRKKKLIETISRAQSAVSQMIVLKGREKLHVGFLPQREKHA
ncbi:unnamed protein product [Fraxinus pennsylvanica]|uniref:Uncharacterized protein n=1 Tax=Fraxinus pennsylvanica TaxID=56036 RepID=A0AAD1Z9S7_9LAMI|nr:unnamed protein product [Fraxinus pennsylvanica]